MKVSDLDILNTLPQDQKQTFLIAAQKRDLEEMRKLIQTNGPIIVYAYVFGDTVPVDGSKLQPACYALDYFLYGLEEPECIEKLDDFLDILEKSGYPFRELHAFHPSFQSLLDSLSLTLKTKQYLIERLEKYGASVRKDVQQSHETAIRDAYHKLCEKRLLEDDLLILQEQGILNFPFHNGERMSTILYHLIAHNEEKLACTTIQLLTKGYAKGESPLNIAVFDSMCRPISLFQAVLPWLTEKIAKNLLENGYGLEKTVACAKVDFRVSSHPWVNVSLFAQSEVINHYFKVLKTTYITETKEISEKEDKHGIALSYFYGIGTMADNVSKTKERKTFCFNQAKEHFPFEASFAQTIAPAPRLARRKSVHLHKQKLLHGNVDDQSAQTPRDQPMDRDLTARVAFRSFVLMSEQDRTLKRMSSFDPKETQKIMLSMKAIISEPSKDVSAKTSPEKEKCHEKSEKTSPTSPSRDGVKDKKEAINISDAKKHEDPKNTRRAKHLSAGSFSAAKISKEFQKLQINEEETQKRSIPSLNFKQSVKSDPGFEPPQVRRDVTPTIGDHSKKEEKKKEKEKKSKSSYIKRKNPLTKAISDNAIPTEKESSVLRSSKSVTLEPSVDTADPKTALHDPSLEGVKKKGVVLVLNHG